jgi:glutamate-1-semialdehyde 2,1-aminomutase
MAVALARNSDLDSALAEAEARYVAANPKSRAQHERALKAMPGGNTRTVLFYSPYPVTIARGEGCRVWDLDGHEYVDFLGEYTAGLYGHSHPVIMAALRRALDGGIVLGGHNESESMLAQAVVDRFPSIERVRFTNSGTEANLMAISTARAFTKRPKVMAMQGGYHGGVFYFVKPELPINAPFPFVFGRTNELDYTRDLIRRHGAELACVIVEPMMGGTGCLPAGREFLAMLREETQACGAVLIFDEVMTSRLGPNGLQGRLGVIPDMTTLGKYVGGGMTFGAFGGRADILDIYDPRRPDAIPHAGTFNNNTLTMNAGYAGLTQVYTAEAAEALNASGEALRASLNALTRTKGLPVQFTGIGSMMAVHFRDGAIRTFADIQAGRQDLKPLLQFDLLARGIYSPRRGMYVLSLPMGEAERDALCAAFEEFFDSRAGLIAG